MPIGGGFFCTGFASLLEYVTRAYAKNIDAAWESCWSRSKQLHNRVKQGLSMITEDVTLY
jgi:hypothetical protein